MPFVIRRLKDPTTAVNNYDTGVQGAGEKWLEGYQNPKRNPQTALKASVPRWKAAVSSAQAAARFETNGSSYDVSDAIAVATSVGKDHYVTGAVARKAKVHKKLTKILAAEATILAHVDTMPTATLAERLAKATYFATQMAALKGTF